jgi:peptidylprolyl isomerase
MMTMMMKLLIFASLLLSLCNALQVSTRRAVLGSSAVVVPFLATGRVALAQPSEFKSMGTQAPLPAGESNEFKTLNDGVKIKDFRVGKDGASVENGSRVEILCTGRLLNLNGVIFYSTKNNVLEGFGPQPINFTIGKGEALPGLESGMIGMKKTGIRRIIVPADLAYSQYPNLMPQPMSIEEQRALDSVVKNPRRDATILFDVQLERIK